MAERAQPKVTLSRRTESRARRPDLHLVARYSNRVALLVAGELLSQGTPQEVLTPDLLSRAYQIPAEAVNLAALGL